MRICPTKDFAANCAGPCEVTIVSNCDYFYVGAEDKVSKIVTDWLRKKIGDYR